MVGVFFGWKPLFLLPPDSIKCPFSFRRPTLDERASIDDQRRDPVPKCHREANSQLIDQNDDSKGKGG